MMWRFLSRALHYKLAVLTIYSRRDRFYYLEETKDGMEFIICI